MSASPGEREQPGHKAWGPYRHYVLEAAMLCADYAGRVERALAGEMPSAPAYVSDKAYALKEAAENLRQRFAHVRQWLQDERGNRGDV